MSPKRPLTNADRDIYTPKTQTPAKGVPVEVEEEVTGKHDGDELAMLRAKRPTHDRIARLEVKGDATAQAQARMEGKLDRPLLQQPVRGRVPTAELTVHIVYESRRHRRLPDLSGTSCGRKYHSEFASVYREELTHANGKLCEDGCFTKVELAIADAEERERMGDP
jgi:hypothetical protein